MKTREEELWELWQKLWTELEDTHVEFDETTGRVLVAFAAEVASSTVTKTLAQLGRRELSAVNPKFEYIRLADNNEVIEATNGCEGKHVQQVCYSSYMGALTQICFTCQKIRGVIDWDGSQSWGGARK